MQEESKSDGELMKGVIVTLIYGIKSVSAQTEYTLEQIAMVVESEFPELAKFIRLCRYVDDLDEYWTGR